MASPSGVMAQVPPGRVTLDLLRKRAEHNGGVVPTLQVRAKPFAAPSLWALTPCLHALGVSPHSPQEVALHSQGLERIELLGHACRELRILYLQNNVIGRIGTPQARCRRCQPSKLTAHRPCREPAPPEGAGVPEPGTEQPDGGAAAHDTARARENTGLSAPPCCSPHRCPTWRAASR